MSFGNLLFSGVLVSLMLAGCSTLPPPPEPPVPIAATSPVPAPQPARPGDGMLFHALPALGVDCRYGRASPETGFDCSGLVAHVYHEAFGIDLPHYTLAQSRFGRAV